MTCEECKYRHAGTHDFRFCRGTTPANIKNECTVVQLGSPVSTKEEE